MLYLRFFDASQHTALFMSSHCQLGSSISPHLSILKALRYFMCLRNEIRESFQDHARIGCVRMRQGSKACMMAAQPVERLAAQYYCPWVSQPRYVDLASRSCPKLHAGPMRSIPIHQGQPARPTSRHPFFPQLGWQLVLRPRRSAIMVVSRHVGNYSHSMSYPKPLDRTMFLSSQRTLEV